jgi:spore maturation protein SpmA
MYEQMVNLFSHFSLVSDLGIALQLLLPESPIDILLNMESNQPTILVLLDFLKTFDSVCNELFILELCQRYAFKLRQRHFSLRIKELHVGTMFLL